MKISTMIKNLEKFMAEHGDVDCYYAVDDEGNEYHKVFYDPELYYINSYRNVFNQLDYDEADEEDREDLTPICVVN